MPSDPEYEASLVRPHGARLFICDRCRADMIPGETCTLCGLDRGHWVGGEYLGRPAVPVPVSRPRADASYEPHQAILDRALTESLRGHLGERMRWRPFAVPPHTGWALWGDGDQLLIRLMSDGTRTVAEAAEGEAVARIERRRVAWRAHLVAPYYHERRLASFHPSRVRSGGELVLVDGDCYALKWRRSRCWSVHDELGAELLDLLLVPGGPRTPEYVLTAKPAAAGIIRLWLLAALTFYVALAERLTAVAPTTTS